MKRQIKYTVLFAAVVAMTLPVTAGAASDYANTAAIFEMGAGARTLGMGGAFIGLADDENAAVYNPAGLAFFEGGGINTTYDDQYGTLTYNSAVGSLGSIGVAGMNLSSGLMDVTNEYGIDTGSTTSYYSTGLIGGFGIRGDTVGLGSTAKQLGFGLQVRSFSSSLHTTTGSGLSLSVSSLYRASLGDNSHFQLGIIVPSVIVTDSLSSDFPLGTITYEDQSGKVVHEEQFPSNFGVGVGIKTDSSRGRSTSMALDWRAQGGLRGGFEQRFSHLAARFGLTGSGTISAGGGLNLGALGAGDFLENATIDGVYRWHSDLGNSWMLSFSARI